ncbi:hypothetical protein EC973_002782 [Apophysomyces ossiformis]|uniref:Uncharacterized protein n=1 Tax=Apophysomyces ossiformis TaxID=679940 RepID=A0A8H7BXJ7_9FUNG|nr:hypothetical protein EC973_002782 [Apophysomyces ossiformis]
MNELQSPTDVRNRSGSRDASYRGYSPANSSPMTLFDGDSPSRYPTRYMERYRSIIRESPPENLHMSTPIDDRSRSTIFSNQRRETKSPASPEPYKSPAANTSIYDRAVKTLYSPAVHNHIATTSYTRKDRNFYSSAVEAGTSRERTVKNTSGSDVDKSSPASARRPSETKFSLNAESRKEKAGNDLYLGNEDRLDSGLHRSSSATTETYGRTMRSTNSPVGTNESITASSIRAIKASNDKETQPKIIEEAREKQNEDPHDSSLNENITDSKSDKSYTHKSPDATIIHHTASKLRTSTSTDLLSNRTNETKTEDSELSLTQHPRRTHRPVGELPHYMLSTLSYKSRLREQQQQQHGPTRTGGIKKRVGTSKVPRFQVTTRTNAVEEIRREMTPDDVFISIAARTKLFEQGLGNGIVPAPKVIEKRESTPPQRNVTPRPTRPRSPKLLTRQRSLLSSQRHNDHHDHHVPSPRNYTLKPSESHSSQNSDRKSSKPTLSTQLKKTEHKSIPETRPKRKHTSSEDLPKTKRQRPNQPLKVKPFHFATDERVRRRHKEAFREKLDLWKDRETQS